MRQNKLRSVGLAWGVKDKGVKKGLGVLVSKCVQCTTEFLDSSADPSKTKKNIQFLTKLQFINMTLIADIIEH
jgi:hypothetical protein